MNQPLRIAIMGGGGRGREAYGSWLLRHPERATVVAIAETIQTRRDEFAQAAGAIPFADWRELVEAIPKLEIDGVVVALPDHLHLEPLLELVKRSIPILVEKPVTPKLEDLQNLMRVHQSSRVPVVVGHVLRFTTFWKTIQRLLSEGAIGETVTQEIRENNGFWHFAHSFVRGNWRRSDESSPMVLAKTCHDLDLIRWLVEERPTRLSSFGGLRHFTSANAPKGAPEFCVDGCPVERVLPLLCSAVLR